MLLTLEDFNEYFKYPDHCPGCRYRNRANCGDCGTYKGAPRKWTPKAINPEDKRKRKPVRPNESRAMLIKNALKKKGNTNKSDGNGIKGGRF